MRHMCGTHGIPQHHQSTPGRVHRGCVEQGVSGVGIALLDQRPGPVQAAPRRTQGRPGGFGDRLHGGGTIGRLIPSRRGPRGPCPGWSGAGASTTVPKPSITTFGPSRAGRDRPTGQHCVAVDQGGFGGVGDGDRETHAGRHRGSAARSWDTSPGPPITAATASHPGSPVEAAAPGAPRSQLARLGACRSRPAAIASPRRARPPTRRARRPARGPARLPPRLGRGRHGRSPATPRRSGRGPCRRRSQPGASCPRASGACPPPCRALRS